VAAPSRRQLRVRAEGGVEALGRRLTALGCRGVWWNWPKMSGGWDGARCTGPSRYASPRTSLG